MTDSTNAPGFTPLSFEQLVVLFQHTHNELQHHANRAMRFNREIHPTASDESRLSQSTFHSNIHASEYRRYLPTKAELKSRIESVTLPEDNGNLNRKDTQ
jgi:hypothetical protein